MMRLDGSKGATQFLDFYIRRSPRTAGALALGAVTLVVQYFAWLPNARMSGLAPALAVAVGLSHAIAGAVTGPCPVDRTRTRTP